GRLEGERLAVGIDVSDDGLRTPGALYDRRFDRRCTMYARANGSVAECLPDDLPAATFYADPDCSHPVLALPAGREVPHAAHMSRLTGCVSMFEVGDELGTLTLYEHLGDSCVPVPVPPGVTLHTAG